MINNRSVLAAAATAFIGASLASPVMAQLPTGGVVVGGSATITPGTSTQLTINQTTDRGVIDWRSFAVGSGNRTDFIQPGSSSVTFNRVVGPDPSIIAGRLSTSGQIVLSTAPGVTFTNGATVRVNGLAGLAGPGAARNGTINARVRRMTVGGTPTMAVDLAGDGLLGLQIHRSALAAANGAGAINATAASVTISAVAARGVVDSITNVQGMAKATGASIEAGAVVFGSAR